MNVLIVNDDGYQAEGINVLARHLSKDNEVRIIAPDGNRSAVSHHITMYAENKLRKISENVWASSGYPADCVDVGLNSKLFGGLKFDVVVAGINHGANMGTDIVYSGTCAAARQAVLCGVPGIAVSLDPVDWAAVNKNGFKFDFLASFVNKNLEKLAGLASLNYPRAFVNVNAAMTKSLNGAVQTDKLCVRNYQYTFELERDECGSCTDSSRADSSTDGRHTNEGNNAGETVSESYKTIYVPCLGETERKNGSDYALSMDGYITVSRVYADYMCAPVVDGIQFSL